MQMRNSDSGNRKDEYSQWPCEKTSAQPGALLGLPCKPFYLRIRLSLKKSFLEKWNRGYFTNKLKIKNGEHGNCELVQDSSHELKVKRYFNWFDRANKANFFLKKKTFLHLKEHTASCTFDKEINIWKWGVWWFQSVNDTATGKKVTYSLREHIHLWANITKCFLSPAIPQDL